MIGLHGGASRNAFLNPAIVITAVATWERFAADLAVAASDSGWRIKDAGWNRKYDQTAPWPGSYEDRRKAERSGFENVLDDVLGAQITSAWRLHVAKAWTGAYPDEWVWVEYSALPREGNRDLLRQAMLGAKSARDAAAHRLYYKRHRRLKSFSRTAVLILSRMKHLIGAMSGRATTRANPVRIHSMKAIILVGQPFNMDMHAV